MEDTQGDTKVLQGQLQIMCQLQVSTHRCPVMSLSQPPGGFGIINPEGKSFGKYGKKTWKHVGKPW